MILLHIIIIGIVATWIAELSIWRLIKTITKRKKIKPFDCEMCLGFWIGLAYFFNQNEIINTIVMAILCSFTAIIISKLLWRC